MSIKYANILSYVSGMPIAMHPGKLQEVAEFLRLKAAGEEILDKEAKISPNTIRAVARREGKVVVIPIMGIISQRVGMLEEISTSAVSTERVAQYFEDAINDDSVKAIVLRIDSPGGSVYGVEELAQKIYQARGKKPIIASVDSLAASAAYWLASAADEIRITPGGEAGSVGVYTMHFNYAQALEAKGVEVSIIKAGEFKAEGNPYQQLSDEAKEKIQADIDHYYDKFVSAVSRHRNEGVSTVKENYGKGRTEVADKALKLGMVDKIQTFAETMAELGINIYKKSESQRPTREGRRAENQEGGRSIYELEHEMLCLEEKQ